MKKFLVFVVFLLSSTEMTTMAIGSMFGLGDLFATKGGVNLEQIMLIIDKDMNNGGAVELHLVFPYTRELDNNLMKLSADEYFQTLDQLKKDHPDKMKIFAWELVAKKRITPWINIKYPVKHMAPVSAIIFVKYNSPGPHRMRISPDTKKQIIILGKSDFKSGNENIGKDYDGNNDNEGINKNYNENNNEDVDNYI